MAVVLGTNSGFVTVAPTADPASGFTANMDRTARVTKDTSPVGATLITEVGWWVGNATADVNFEVALYDAGGTDGNADQIIHVDRTNAKGAGAGWKRVTVNWSISAETDYWIGVQLDNTTATYSDYLSTGGKGHDNLFSQDTLPDPWNGGTPASTTGMLTFYALVEVPVGTNMQINISDAWKDIDSIQINIGDVWKDVVQVQQNIGDVWKTVFG